MYVCILCIRAFECLDRKPLITSFAQRSRDACALQINLHMFVWVCLIIWFFVYAFIYCTHLEESHTIFLHNTHAVLGQSFAVSLHWHHNKHVYERRRRKKRRKENEWEEISTRITTTHHLIRYPFCGLSHKKVLIPFTTGKWRRRRKDMAHVFIC